MPNKEKVLAGLKFHYTTSCVLDGEKCPYFKDNDCSVVLMKEAEELLKNSEPVVRCKDCKHGKPSTYGYGIDCDGRWYDDDGFCSDGERR